MTQKKHHRAVSIDAGLLKRAEQFIGVDAGYGYKSLASLVEDSIRRRLEDLEKSEK